MPPLILASTSPYRAALLNRLGFPFSQQAPVCDETPLAGEAPRALAERLALSKARSVADSLEQGLVIGSDQVAELDGQAIGKPGNAQRAAEQLAAASGRRVIFHTGLALVDAATGEAHLEVVPFTVHFHTLTAEQIHRYLELEQPFDCAGSFKMEGLGIALFRALEGEDPNALVGLPLIRLSDQLRQRGMDPLLGLQRL
uniref:7-methyl-GTP pyrophosphatase n=1 Tax=Magnetococcus massalia (strain MO-1) TaxID=451514 RepID=A0A1S7LQT7_MAGMO|nr:Maf-like protein [Candidatus Magnetococcus massalia]